MLYVITASHITSPKRFDYLCMCINSVKVVAPNAIHLISTYATCDIWEKKGNNIDGVEVTIQNHVMTQFEHIRYLLCNNNFQLEDMIMFLDDDDLLLDIPEEISKGLPISSLQWLPLRHEDIDGSKEYYLADFRDNQHNLSQWDQVCDFSGYCLSYKDMLGYSTPANAIASMEDLELMNYIDKLPLMKKIEYPYIFHRCHNEMGEGSKWMQDVTNELRTLVGNMQLNSVDFEQILEVFLNKDI